jgi:hypothetical protein
LRSGRTLRRRARRLGASRGWRLRSLGSLAVHLAKLIEQIAACRRLGSGRGLLAGGSTGCAIDDRALLAILASHHRQQNGENEERRGEDRCGARQRIGLSTPGKEALDAAATAAATEAETAALGTLQQHDANQRENDKKMDNEQNALHGAINQP